MYIQKQQMFFVYSKTTKAQAVNVEIFTNLNVFDIQTKAQAVNIKIFLYSNKSTSGKYQDIFYIQTKAQAVNIKIFWYSNTNIWRKNETSSVENSQLFRIKKYTLCRKN